MIDRITTALRSYRLRFGTEADLQADIVELLTTEQIDFVREYRLSAKDRIDFLIGRIGIECKTKGSLGAIAQQLLRYAESDEIDALVLVTRRQYAMPSTLQGKPLRVVWIGGSGL
jgi:hypothetical protein